MKGHAEIILTDVATGEVKTVSEDNIVTNAVQDLITINPAGLRGGIPWGLPIVPNAIGGVLLFPDTIIEDPDEYYAPSDMVPVGYASNEVDSTADPKRGSYNVNESVLSDGSCKLVWDFGTADANGEINCICLTSAQGGRAYFGSPYLSDPNWYYEVYTGYWDMSADDDALYKNISALDGEHAYAGRMTTLSQIQWGVWDKPVESLALRQTNSISTASLVKTLIDLENEYWSSGYENSSGEKSASYNYNQGFTRQFNNRRGITFDNCDYWVWYWKRDDPGGDVMLCKVTNGVATEWTMNYEGLRLMDASFATIANGYIYSWAIGGDGIYKMSTTDESDVTFIPLPDGKGVGSTIYAITSPFSDGKLVTSWNYTSGGTTLHYSAIIFDDKMEPTYRYSYEWNRNTGNSTQKRGKRFGPYYLQPYYYTYNSGNDTGWRLSVITPYLATINNLAEPITKTSAQTMKIVYTLTEE